MKLRSKNDNKMTDSLDNLLIIDASVLVKKIKELSESERAEMAKNLGDTYERLSYILGRGGKFEEEIGDYKINVDEVDIDPFWLGSRTFRFRLFQKEKEVILKKGCYDAVFNYYYIYSLVLKGIKQREN